MSDLLKEIYIKQAQRENAATTESEKIASLNVAYAQAQKVKKQREIDALRKKSADLKVKAVNQKVEADKAEQTAKESISREQQLQKFNYDFYLSGLKKGIYDPKAAKALGVSEKVYKGVLAKIQADLAPKPTKSYTYTPIDDGQIEGEPKKSPQQLTYAVNSETMQQELETLAKEPSTKVMTAAEREAKRRAMNDDVAGVGQRNLNSTTAKKKQIAQIEKHQAVDTQTATMVYNLNTAVQKHGKDKVLPVMLKYVDESGDARKALENIFDTSNRKEILGNNQRAFLMLLRTDDRLGDKERNTVSVVLHNDTVYKVDRYKKFLESLDNDALDRELKEPTQNFGINSENLIGIAYDEYWKRNPDEEKIWILTETGEQLDNDSTEKRADAAVYVEEQIAEIDKEIAELDIDSIEFRKGKVNTDANERLRRYYELSAKREKLQNALTRYEHIFSKTDKLYTEYSSKDDWNEKSNNREHGNATKEDFDEYDTKMYGGYVGYYDGRENTTVIPSEEKAGKKPTINDPLGFYLSFTNSSRSADGENQFYSPNQIVAGRECQEIVIKADKNDWDRVTEAEKSVYYYILNDQGKEKAIEYLDTLTSELNYRTTLAHAESIKRASGGELLAMNLLSIPLNILGGMVATTDNILRTLNGEEINPYGSAYSMLNQANIVRGETARRIDKSTNNANLNGFTWGDTYQSLMSGADSLVGAAVFGKGYSVLMGSNAAATTAKDLYERGATKGQIMSGSIAVGVIAAVSEKLTLDRFFNLGKPDSFLKWIKNIVKSGMPEALEEVVEEISGTIVDIVNMRSHSEWAKLVKENDGSFGKALLQTAQQVYKAGMGGFVSGATLGGLGTAGDYLSNQIRLTSQGREFVESGGVPFLQVMSEVVAKETGGEIAKKLEEKSNKLTYVKKEGKGIGKIIAGIKNGRNYRNIARVAEQLGDYGTILQQVHAGKTISEIQSYMKEISNISPAEVRRMATEIKKGFVSSLSSDAKSDYKKTITDPKKAGAWIGMYNAGLNDIELKTFADTPLSPKAAQAAYEFGRAAQAVTDDAQDIDERGNSLYNKNTIGGIENGSENTGVLEGIRFDRGNNGVRQQGTNSSKLAACLEVSQNDDGTTGKTVWAGESGWLDGKTETEGNLGKGFAQRIIGKVRGIKLSGRDTIGRTISSEIYQTFKDTVFKDENGNLISLWHWTEAIFDKFEKGEFGFHFGTLNAARDRYNQTRDGKSNVQPGVYKEVYLNITNPIELNDGAGEWSAGWVALQLLEKGIITAEQYESISVMEGFYEQTYNNPAAEMVRSILSQNGYDGIVYENQSEDSGSISVIALYPEQILTVAENGVLKENQGIDDALVEQEQSGQALDEGLAKALFIAGMNGVPIEQAADMDAANEQERWLMQIAYENGKARQTGLSTVKGTYRQGKGKVQKSTKKRFGIKADVPMMRQFARVHHLDVEILDDGSIKGKAAYDVAAFRILMSKSAENEHFYHEVFENMLAINPEVFDRLERSMIEHYLRTHTLGELEQSIVAYMDGYDTNDYALGRKEWVCSYAAKQLGTAEGTRAFIDWLETNESTRTLGQRIAAFFRRLFRAIRRAMSGDWIGTAEKQNGAKLSAELENIIALLEENRAYQAALKDGQKITIGGGRSAVRYSLPFYSLKAKDVNRIGWAEELFSSEDKMLLNDRFVDIMIRKDLGDAVRLKGGSYLLDVNNKIVIIGGSFENPVIHYVMVINAENATYAQELKGVIFENEKRRNRKGIAREVAKRLKVFETYIGKGFVRTYDGQDFGYSSTSTHLYARLPEGFGSYGYTQRKQNGSGVSTEDGSDERYRYSLDVDSANEQEHLQDVLVSASRSADGSAATGKNDLDQQTMTAIYYAGKTGASIESVYDGEITETVQNIYADGQRDGGTIGSTPVTIHKGKGQYFDTSNSKSEMENFLIKFAQKTGIDINRVTQIAVKYKDGSIKENGAAGKFVVDLLKIIISEKATSERKAFGHEMGEALQALLDDEFNEVGKVLIDHYLSDHTVDELNKRILDAQAKYGKVKKTSYPAARKEVICDLLGEVIDNDGNFKALVDWVNASDMSAKEKTSFIENLKKLVQKIVDIFKSIGRGDYIGTSKSDRQMLNKPTAEMQVILKALDALVERVNSLQNGDTVTISGSEGGVRNSIGETDTGIPVLVVNDDITRGAKDSEEVIKRVKKLMSRFKRVPIHGQNIMVTKKSRKEFTHSKYSEKIRKKDPQKFADKMRAATHTVEVIYATTDYVNETPNHPRKDDIVNFSRGNILMQIMGSQYTAEVVYAISKDGFCMLYDIVEFNDANFTLKKADAFKAVHSLKVKSDRQKASAKNRITQGDPSVNSYSMQKEKKDSQNGELSIDTTTTDDTVVAELTAKSDALKEQSLSKYVKEEYNQAVDESLLDFIVSIHSMNDEQQISKRKYRIGKLSKEHADMIKSIIEKESGKTIDLSGYELWINGSGVRHIDVRHGKQGKRDQSMKDDRDVARLPWVIDNADGGSVVRDDAGEIEKDNEFTNSDRTPALQVRLEKQITDMTIYVVECVPDSQQKRIYIKSAYIEKGGKGQELNMENNSPQLTSETLLDSNATKDIVANETDHVKQNRLTEEYSLNAIEEKVEHGKRHLPSSDAQAIGVQTARMDELARNSGRIPQGEHVKRDIAVPRKVNGEKTMRWARTFFESGVGTPEMVDPVAEDLLNEALSYKAVSNESAFNVAEGMLERKGYEGAIAYFESAVDDGRFSKDIAALGQLLLNTAAEMKDYHNVKKLVVLISEMGTAAGQTVQALSMLKRMDGEAKLFAVQRAVNKINRELAAGKYGKRNDDIKVVLGGGAKGSRVIEVDPVLIQRLLEAGEDAELSSAVTTEIYKDIARQLPRGSFEDGWNAWRYFAMLSAPTTHVRNVTGNAAFMPMVVMKNSLKRIGELLLTQEGDERTAKILPASKKARDYARADALKMETILKSGGKYNEEDVIEQVRKKLPGFLDKLAKFNGAALEWEDWRFLKYHYVSTMSKYLDVNHINPDNITNEQLTRARNYAIQEAMKATYRDGSQLADALNKFSKSKSSGLAGKVLEGVLPFKKTPINILKRGIEYSPLGLIRAMTWGAYNLYNQNITINEWLDGFCAGLSGSLIVALGAFAFSLGLVQGGFGMDDDDPEDKAQDNLKRLSGIQEYSIRIGNFSYTLDWAAPAAIPFFMGVELAEAFAEEDGNLFNRVTDAIIDGTDVIVRTSMLDGLQGTIDAIKYESGAAGAILANSLVNYASQAFPAVLGKQANMMDGTRRANFVDPDSVMPNYLQRIGNKLIAKVPILSKTRNAYIDEFGREKTENNWALRFFQNFISPGYYSKIEYGALEEMMSEIYANAEEPKTIPVTSSKSFVLNGKRIYLNAKEYEQFARERGQIAHKIMTEMIASDNFDKLSYNEMQELLKKAYEYSGAVAKHSVSDYELEGWQLQAEKLEKKGVAISDFILYKHLITDKEKEESLKVLQQAGMSYAQARRHISSINTSFMKDYEKDGISVDITVNAAIAMEKGDYSNYQSAVDRIVSMGYSEQDAIEAIHSEAGISGDYIKGSIYTSGDLYNAILTSSDSYKSIYDELVRANINNGKKVGAAKSSVKSGITRRFKTAYENADGAGRAEIKQQMLRCGLYTQSGEVQQRIYTWSKLNK